MASNMARIFDYKNKSVKIEKAIDEMKRQKYDLIPRKMWRYFINVGLKWPTGLICRNTNKTNFYKREKITKEGMFE